ncbi:helix-turn-helix domain-containing protein [Parageobacillus thermoglucosidasius]|uniref:helix-turn-helix domain-containing protein n=1 Tax=Parageobacillus thermoglucosidasius TaxID=1426 RepID=UPI000E133851|nr:helix-turn-helix transcriptional regulator [Parageobacillus thermoglucosidasius]RDE19304.1 helix-turn-helix domain-containing protein [Parageobacillus thermoglucosidasius]
MIGDNIKFFRKKAKMTQVELAEKANISRSYLADVERNRYNPSLDTLKAIASALNVPVNSLIGEEDTKNLDRDTKLPELTEKDERDIAKDLQRIMDSLESREGLMYDGEPMDEETRELIHLSLENSMRLAKRIAKKKFTPKKYRK